ncbi:hypothetical protein ACUTAF_08015 [Pseudomonas sp. SP16.1]|uniref:hypothetical protein n=1 Tax=Pseudomonas sp. SP16.1 TaxID=3458854 RepID=UPI004045EF93
MLRLALAIVLAGALLAGATLLYLLTTTLLFALGAGLLLGLLLVVGLRVRRCRKR